MASFDVVLQGGLLVDGYHSSRAGDVGVRGDSIAAIAPPGTLSGTKVLDCQGKVVSPGFIDTHTHGDVVDLLRDSEADSLRLAPLLEGVTTQVVGNCGFSTFGGTGRDRVNSKALRAHLEQLMGEHGTVFDTAEAYIEALSEAGMTQNVMALAGHGSLVAAGIHGGERSGAADVQRRLAHLVDWGVCGLSAGLIYSHGRHTSTDDLVVAARGLAGSNLPVAFHVRGESHKVVDSVKEAIFVAEQAGVPCHISHHKIAGVSNWGKSTQTLTLVDEARSRGVDVTLDVYPYTSSSTSLHALLPPAFVVGGQVQWQNFGNDIRLAGRRLDEAVAQEEGAWENMIGAAGWSKIWIAAGQGCEEHVGSSLEHVGTVLGLSPAESAMELLRRAKGPVTVVFESLSPEDVTRIIRHDSTMIGSDGIPLPGKPHQRWAGSHAQLLGSYVRDMSALSLEEAIYKMAGHPASRFGLETRGMLVEGFVADLVVFDPGLVEAGASRMQPLTPPRGVSTVMINGRIAVADGVPVRGRFGRFLRPSRTARSA